MSPQTLIDSHPVRQIMIVPHRTLTTDTGLTRNTIRCPRCHESMVLPDWASDGDLTECCGLLLRVSREGHRYTLESL